MEESICRRKWTTLCKIFTFCPDECGKLRGYPDQWTWHYCYIKIVWLLFFPLSSRWYVILMLSCQMGLYWMMDLLQTFPSCQETWIERMQIDCSWKKVYQFNMYLMLGSVVVRVMLQSEVMLVGSLWTEAFVVNFPRPSALPSGRISPLADISGFGFGC